MALSYRLHGSSLPLHPLLTFGGGMGCAREGGLVSAWAAAFLHRTRSGYGAASPHTGAVTALHEPKAVSPEMSCSLSLSY